MRRPHFAPAFGAAATLLFLAACSPTKPVDPRTEAPFVRSSTVDSLSQSGRSFTGVVVARVQSSLGFRVPGKVVERVVDTGQTVKKGQVLMRIDPEDLSLTDRAQDEAVAAAKAHALQAAADEQRYRDLVAAGAVSASTYDQIKATSEAAQAQLNGAQAQARVSHNAAGYAELLADSDGVVIDTLAEPGQVVAAGQTVVHLAHAGPREALVDLPETIRPTLGSQAQAELYSNSGIFVSARLRQLSDAADPRTRTYEAHYVLEGAASNAPLGATVAVRITDAHEGPAATLPLTALYDQGHGPGVWLVDGKTMAVKWSPVQLSDMGVETATVVNGLKPGDRFVTLGAHLLHEGEVVRLVDGANAGVAK